MESNSQSRLESIIGGSLPTYAKVGMLLLALVFLSSIPSLAPFALLSLGVLLLYVMYEFAHGGTLSWS